jgi:hypothetical protein
MARSNYKPDEIFARDHLLKFLDKHYSGYTVDESITDAPDFVFTYKSKRIGIEFAHITIAQLMEWAARKQYDDLKHDVRYIVTIPIEPHIWITKILSVKDELVKKYINNCNLDECWILLHQGDNSRKWFIPDDESLRDVLKIYASNIPTKFRKVLYLHQDSDVINVKSSSYKGPHHIFSIAETIKKGWPAREIHLVRTNFEGKVNVTVNIDDVQINEHIFIPYLEPGVKHGDPRANA